MSSCIRGREVIIKLSGHSSNDKVICPVKWEKKTFIKYVVGEHPYDNLEIISWGEDKDFVWIANPRDFKHYIYGIFLED